LQSPLGIGDSSVPHRHTFTHFQPWAGTVVESDEWLEARGYLHH
jgi:hypothetical protein